MDRPEVDIQGRAVVVQRLAQVLLREAEPELPTRPAEVPGHIGLHRQVAEHRDNEVQPHEVALVGQVSDSREDPVRLRGRVHQDRAQSEVVFAQVERLERADGQQLEVVVPVEAGRIVEVLTAEGDALVFPEGHRVGQPAGRLDHRRRCARCGDGHRCRDGHRRAWWQRQRHTDEFGRIDLGRHVEGASGRRVQAVLHRHLSVEVDVPQCHGEVRSQPRLAVPLGQPVDAECPRLDGELSSESATHVADHRPAGPGGVDSRPARILHAGAARIASPDVLGRLEERHCGEVPAHPLPWDLGPDHGHSQPSIEDRQRVAWLAGQEVGGTEEPRGAPLDVLAPGGDEHGARNVEGEPGLVEHHARIAHRGGRRDPRKGRPPDRGGEEWIVGHPSPHEGSQLVGGPGIQIDVHQGGEGEERFVEGLVLAHQGIAADVELAADLQRVLLHRAGGKGVRLGCTVQPARLLGRASPGRGQRRARIRGGGAEDHVFTRAGGCACRATGLAPRGRQAP